MSDFCIGTPKVTAWCAISASIIIGPYFFEENGVTVTVNSERYVKMFAKDLFWLQQDGATCHGKNQYGNFARTVHSD